MKFGIFHSLNCLRVNFQRLKEGQHDINQPSMTGKAVCQRPLDSNLEGVERISRSQQSSSGIVKSSASWLYQHSRNREAKRTFIVLTKANMVPSLNYVSAFYSWPLFLVQVSPQAKERALTKSIPSPRHTVVGSRHHNLSDQTYLGLLHVISRNFIPLKPAIDQLR